MSGKEPTESKRDDYRHAHQDIRLGGRAASSGEVVHFVTMPELRDRARSRVQIVPERSVVTLQGDARLPASTSQIDTAVSATARPAEPDFTKAFPPAAMASLKDKAIEFAGNLADRYVMGRSQIHRAVKGEPSSYDAIKADIALAKAQASWTASHERLNDACLEARIAEAENPCLENLRAFEVAEKALLDFQYADDSAWSIPAHPRHKNWIEGRAERTTLLMKEITSADEIMQEFDRALNTPEIEHFLPDGPGIVRPFPTFDEVMGEFDEAWFRHREVSTPETEAALAQARRRLTAHPYFSGIAPEVLRALEEQEQRDTEELEQTALGDFVPMPPFPKPTSIEILADLGITAEPVGVVENFSDVWCVFCDYCQFRILDMPADRTRESRVEIALTRHAAFWTMVRMSGFNEDVVAQLPGVSLEEACPDALSAALNEVTNDYYSFSPYETALDQRILNFLQ